MCTKYELWAAWSHPEVEYFANESFDTLEQAAKRKGEKNVSLNHIDVDKAYFLMKNIDGFVCELDNEEKKKEWAIILNGSSWDTYHHNSKTLKSSHAT
jgi:hypothetical protein